MLPINSTNEVVPGGPVSSANERNEIFGGAKISSFANEKSAPARSTIGQAKFFAELATVARKILQQGELLDCFGFAGVACLE